MLPNNKGNEQEGPGRMTPSLHQTHPVNLIRMCPGRPAKSLPAGCAEGSTLLSNLARMEILREGPMLPLSRTQRQHPLAFCRCGTPTDKPETVSDLATVVEV